MLVVADVLVCACATILAFLARFEAWPPPAPYFELLPRYAATACLLRIAVFYATGAYSQAWRYASVREAANPAHPCDGPVVHLARFEFALREELHFGA